MVAVDDLDADEADKWPLPPPWMWDCGDCVTLYRRMREAPELAAAAREEVGPGIDCDPFDQVITTQIRLSQHIANQHTAHVPATVPSCGRCASDEVSTTMPRALVLEHRARHLVVPPSIVGGI